jgi:hypothetical protein
MKKMLKFDVIKRLDVKKLLENRILEEMEDIVAGVEH